MTVDLVLNNAKAYISNEIVDCSLAINAEKICKIGKRPTMPRAETQIDLKNLLVLPGLIDVHVHLRDEGKEYKEDFYSGTAAAAAGGMTTVLDMPNNSPVTMSVQTVKNRMKVAENKILVNVGFYSEFPENMSEIAEIHSAGAIAFKLYMAEQIGGLEIDDDNALLKAFELVNKLETLVAVHAEDRKELKRVEDEFKLVKSDDFDGFLKAHSRKVEVKAVTRLLDIVRQTEARTHFCHISTKNGLEMVRNGKRSGMAVTCEATPHHLLISVDDLKHVGTLALTMPPVREEYDIASLWKGIWNGWIDILASDHAPHTFGEKKAGSIWDVKVGISGLETAFSLLLTEVKHGHLSLADLVRLMSEKPAQIFELKGKGSLKEGNCADLVVVDLDRTFKIDSSRFHSKAKYSPFDGKNVQGKPVKTFVNGALVMDEGEILGKAGSGRIIKRTTH